MYMQPGFGTTIDAHSPQFITYVHIYCYTHTELALYVLHNYSFNQTVSPLNFFICLTL